MTAALVWVLPALALVLRWALWVRSIRRRLHGTSVLAEHWASVADRRGSERDHAVWELHQCKRLLEQSSTERDKAIRRAHRPGHRPGDERRGGPVRRAGAGRAGRRGHPEDGVNRPRLLDLFAGAGGSAMGYYRAGFDVVGVDVVAQPHYPFGLHVADALSYPLDGFDAVHASPPCRDHSALATVRGRTGTGWLLAATRERLVVWGGPYVIENVPGADMPGALVLCGTEFGLTVVDQDGQQRWLRRHRQFEANVPLLGAGGCYCYRKRIGGVYGHGGGEPRTQVGKGGRRRGGYQLGPDQARAVLGVPWMNRDEAAQAIPPAYTEHLGAFLLAALYAEVPA